MPAPRDTKTHIIESAIKVLKTFGTEGLTMRKVASEADMSLGNLQYHFKNQRSLMVGLAEYYFSECARMLDSYQHAPQEGIEEAKVRSLILFLLDHVDHISDMCRIFREIWALSARDSEIHTLLIDFYRISLERLTSLLEPLCDTHEAARSIASLLLPYIEGYSIAGEALSQRKEETADMLARLCSALRRDVSQSAHG